MYLVGFLKEFAFGFVDSLCLSLCSKWLISALSLTISCLLALLGVFASFCFRAFRCAVKLLVWDLSNFFIKAFSTMNFPLNFPLNDAFIVSHMFGYNASTFSLNSRKSFISFFISSLTNLSLNKDLFSFHVYVGFLKFLLLLKTSLRLWWSDRMHGIISIFLYQLRVVLWPIIWSVLEKIPQGTEKKAYSFVLVWNVL